MQFIAQIFNKHIQTLTTTDISAQTNRKENIVYHVKCNATSLIPKIYQAWSYWQSQAFMVVWQLNYLKLEDLFVNSSKSRYSKATGDKQNTFLQFELNFGYFWSE